MANNLPLYTQVAARIKTQIESENYETGDKLPYESWYVEHFGVSRVTVRKAIDELIHEGVIERRPYHGLYVAQRKLKIMQANSPIYSLQSADGTIGDHLLTSKVLSFNEIEATGKLEQLFSWSDSNRTLYHLYILRLSNGEPVVLQHTFLKKAAFPDLDILLLRDYPLYELLEKKYDISIGHVDVSMTVAVPTEEEAALMKMPTINSLLKATDTLYSADGEVIRYSISMYANSVNYNYTLYM